MKKATYGNKLVIFTDLDGTLLSTGTYTLGLAQESLKLCRQAGIPVVFVSSKTRAEMEKLKKELDNNHPFVSENGGAVFIPRQNWDKPSGWRAAGAWWYLPLSQSYHLLCRALKDAAYAAGAEISGFSAMSVAQVAGATHLPEEDAALAKRREFDEPFIILNESQAIISRLKQQINTRGFKYTRGGLFHHITGDADKGEAVKHLLTLYRQLNPRLKSAAIGDALNDVPMLRAVERPFLVRKPDGSFEAAANFDGVMVTKGIGPHGFCEAIDLLLKSAT